MKFLIILTFFLFLLENVFAQFSDIELLKNQNFRENQYETKRKVSFGVTEKSNFLHKINPISWILGGTMFFYQKFLSPQASSNCPYSPSCSEYSKNLIKKFGVVKGCCCSADRLLRCNDFSLKSIPKMYFDRKSRKIKESVEYYQFYKP